MLYVNPKHKHDNKTDLKADLNHDLKTDLKLIRAGEDEAVDKLKQDLERQLTHYLNPDKDTLDKHLIIDLPTIYCPDLIIIIIDIIKHILRETIHINADLSNKYKPIVINQTVSMIDDYSSTKITPTIFSRNVTMHPCSVPALIKHVLHIPGLIFLLLKVMD